MSLNSLFLILLNLLPIITPLSVPYERTIPYCAVENPATKECTSCDMGYGLTEEKKCSRCSDQFCMSCLTDYKSCQDCLPYFTKDSKGVCVRPADKNCIYHNGAKCSRCDFGYYLNTTSGLCEKGEIKNCETYNKKDECFICDDGFGVDKKNGNLNKCEKCGEHCKICGQSAQKCEECEKGYYLEKSKDGKEAVCKKCIENCNKCENTEKCLACDRGFYQEDLNKCNKGCDDFGCDQCIWKGKGNCIKCLPGYQVNDNGECDKLIEHCLQNDEWGICRACEEGYYADYTEDFSTKICKKEIKGCVRTFYQSNWDICLRCKKNYLLSEDYKKCTYQGEGNSGLFITVKGLLLGLMLLMF